MSAADQSWSPTGICTTRHCVNERSSVWIDCARELNHSGPHTDPRGFLMWDLTTAGAEHDRAASERAAAYNAPEAIAARQSEWAAMRAERERVEQIDRDRRHREAVAGERFIRDWLAEGNGQLMWRPAATSPDGQILRTATRAHVWLTDRTACESSAPYAATIHATLPEGASLCLTCTQRIGRLGRDALRRDEKISS